MRFSCDTISSLLFACCVSAAEVGISIYNAYLLFDGSFGWVTCLEMRTDNDKNVTSAFLSKTAINYDEVWANCDERTRGGCRQIYLAG